MKTVIVACRTLESELLLAMNKNGIAHPVLWLESGLHNSPKKLNSKLQETLNSVRAQRVLAVLGFCGNAVQNIKAGEYELILPRVDDCISLLIGSAKARMEISDKFAAYFLTEGWLRGERNLWVEYQYSLEKYGKEQAQSIAEEMYRHYRTLGLLDSGAGSIASLIEKTKIIAKTLNLEQKVIPATIAYIEELLVGPWPKDRFVFKSPGESITTEDLQL